MTTRQQRRALERALSPAMDNLVKMATAGIRAAMVSPGASPSHNVIAVVDDDSFLIEMKRVERAGTHVLLRNQLHAELAGLGLADIAEAFASEPACGHFQVMLSSAQSIQSSCAVCDLGFTVPGSS